MRIPRSTETWPSSGDSSRMIMRKTVDFPAPFGPQRPTFSPRWMAADASTNRICGPCCLLIWSRRIISIGTLGGFRTSRDELRAAEPRCARRDLAPIRSLVERELVQRLQVLAHEADLELAAAGLDDR